MPDPVRVRRTPATVGVAVGAVVVQCVALYWPSVPTGVGGGVPGLDKVVHLGIFALATWALVRVMDRRLAIGLMVAQVAASETIQGTLLPERSADLFDALADLVGIGLGVWLGRNAVRRRLETDGKPAGVEGRPS